MEAFFPKCLTYEKVSLLGQVSVLVNQMRLATLSLHGCSLGFVWLGLLAGTTPSQHRIFDLQVLDDLSRQVPISLVV